MPPGLRLISMGCPSFVPILVKVSQFAVSLCRKAPLIMTTTKKQKITTLRIIQKALFRPHLHKLSPTLTTFAKFVGAQRELRQFLFRVDIQDSVRHAPTDVSGLQTKKCAVCRASIDMVIPFLTSFMYIHLMFCTSVIYGHFITLHNFTMWF